MSDVTRLEYAPKPPVYQRKIWRRVLAASATMSLIVSGIFIFPIGLRRARVSYWQNACLQYQAPPTVTVVNFDSSKNPAWNFGSSVDPLPHLLWFDMSSNSYLLPTDKTVYVHAVHRPDGAVRMIDIHFIGDAAFDSGGPFCVEGDIFEPGSIGNFPRFIRFIREFKICHLGRGPYPKTFKIYAGQPDPTNPSHLTIDYDLDGHRHTIDGWLDNNDNLMLVQRPESPTTAKSQ